MKTIQERIGHALRGSFTLDVYGHALEWKSNEEAAQRMGDQIEKATQKAALEDEKLPILVSYLHPVRKARERDL